MPARPAMRVRSAAALLLAVVAAAGCTGHSKPAANGQTGPGGTRASDLRWADCSEANLAGFQCATLDVPLDHTQPEGRTIGIALARKRAAGKKSARIGSLVVNPGGPGASGIDLAASLATGLSSDVTDRFDLVGFDPRGVGRSAPVRCIDDLDADVALDGDPDTPAEVAALDAERQTVAAACTSRHGEELPHLTTAESARDLDRIRAALGDDKLTYLGFSYGTQLGATYATLFPERTRALVLDGAVAPGLSPAEQALTQARGFEHAFENFAAACHTDPTCAAYPDAAAAYAAASARAEATPLAAKTTGKRRTVTAGVFQTAVASALYDQSLWGFLARGLVEGAAGDGTTLLGLADLYSERKPDGTYSNLADAFRAISCEDQTERPTVADTAADVATFAAAAPRFGAMAAWSLSTCAGFPAAAEAPIVAGHDAPLPVLVVGTVGDPATPYEWAGRLAAALGGAPVLTWEGEGHTAYPKTSCVADAVDAFLLELTAPPSDQRCPAGATTGPSPFGGLAEELRKALADSGLADDAARCVADKLAGALTPADLAALSGPNLPSDLQRQVTEFISQCARGR